MQKYLEHKHIKLAVAMVIFLGASLVAKVFITSNAHTQPVSLIKGTVER